MIKTITLETERVGLDQIRQILAEKTTPQWEESEGPDTGFGTDYYFRNHLGQEAAVNIDQGYVTIRVGDYSDD